MQSLVTRLSKSANATAWGTLCAVVGHSLSTWLQTSGLSFVGQYQLTFIGYITGAAIYTLLSRRYRHISGCLGFAALMFEEDKRAHCLQRGGPHWNKIIRFNSSHRGLLGHSEVVPCSIRSAALGAQTQQGSWSNLNRVKAGQGIEVIESSMKRHAGKFVTVTDELLTLKENGSDVPVKREDVARVSTSSGPKRGEHALIGLVVGGVVGAGIGAASGSLRGIGALVGVVIGAPSGAVVGAVLPAHTT